MIDILTFRGLWNMDENSNILKVMGENIRIARTQKGYTQDKLAELLNTSDKFISMVERGASGLSMTTLVNLCNILNIEPNILFNGIIKYANNEDTCIINNLSILTAEDKKFVSSVINYIIYKGTK